MPATSVMENEELNVVFGDIRVPLGPLEKYSPNGPRNKHFTSTRVFPPPFRNTTRNSSPARGRAPLRQKPQKRRRCTSYGSDKAGDNDDAEKDRSISQSSRGRREEEPHQKASDSSSGSIRFACPFYRKNPIEHGECGKYHLNRLKDVKQHIIRVHGRPEYYCPICWKWWKKKELRDKHLLQRNCEPRKVTLEGITEEQKKELGQIKVPRTQANATQRQWFNMWGVLFPDTPKPEPGLIYVAGTVQEAMFVVRFVWKLKGKDILSEVEEEAKRNAVETSPSSPGGSASWTKTADLRGTLESLFNKLLENDRPADPDPSEISCVASEPNDTISSATTESSYSTPNQHSNLEADPFQYPQNLSFQPSDSVYNTLGNYHFWEPDMPVCLNSDSPTLTMMNYDLYGLSCD